MVKQASGSCERTDDDVARTSDRITVVENTAIQQAIDFLNREFFDGRLPDVFVRYETRANSDGFYTPKRVLGA